MMPFLITAMDGTNFLISPTLIFNSIIKLNGVSFAGMTRGNVERELERTRMATSSSSSKETACRF